MKKLPGKTEFSGRRRTASRESGFKSAEGSTGGEFIFAEVESRSLKAADEIIITQKVPQQTDHFAGFGGWFTSDHEVTITVVFPEELRMTLVHPESPNWGKIGAMWVADSNDVLDIEIRFSALQDCTISTYCFEAGTIGHPYLDKAISNESSLISNMYQFAPEANFYIVKGVTVISGGLLCEPINRLALKSCNRCARFLPININNERAQLSFSNHCVAEHRRPCSHSGFGKLKNVKTGEILQLEYGYQLECRFCKKFEVNAAHNPQRTSGQMKEDGARRRSFELLLTDLSGGSPQLQFRHNHDGQELSDYIWKKFDKKCFKCSTPLASPKIMNLDHTRPLALLYPLDETATALCKECNSSKRDKSPADFYTPNELLELSKITQIPIENLRNPSPNKLAIEKLISKKEWLFSTFILRPELSKIREGKKTSDLFLKALNKVFYKAGLGKNYFGDY